jgi:hypothetical protein
MFSNDRPPEGFDHAVESFIAENLSIFQARWIKIQFATNPPQACESRIEAELVRRAVGDFILRHHAEFLPVSPFG